MARKKDKKTKEKKDRYSIGEEFSKAHRYWFSRFFIFVGKKIAGKVIDVTYEEPLPDEPCIICANHSREYGPLAMVATMREARIWSISKALRVRRSPKFTMEEIYPSAKGIAYVLRYIATMFICIPLICLIKAQEPIPVYSGKGFEKTVERSMHTLKEGKDVVIFVENDKPHEDYKFVNQIGRGFAYLVKSIKTEMQKPTWVIPAYVCKSLHRVCYGKPILAGDSENFVENFKTESNNLVSYVMDEIERLGNSLPKHKIVNYNDVQRTQA